jgi:GTP-binding protein
MIANEPPHFLLFVNAPAYCADNYLAYLKNALRSAFDFTGLPLVVTLRARPKKVVAFHTESRSRSGKSGGRSPHRPGTRSKSGRGPRAESRK